MLKNNISIIGCGWLGLSLAKSLINDGISVKGSTTSIEKLDMLKKQNIDAYVIKLKASGLSGNYRDFLENSKTIIINIPPGLRKKPEKSHVIEMTYLIKAIEVSKIENVIYISSTSVFKDSEKKPIIEYSSVPDADTNSGQQLITIEQLLLKNSNFNTTVLRFGGLVGEDRHPGNFLSGRKNISNPEAPINLIHRTDCIAIIKSIVQKNIWNVSLNAVYPLHPKKKLYYSNYCGQNSLALPQFNLSDKSKGKIVDSSKLVQLLNYTFEYAP